MKVKEWMHRNPPAVRADAPVSEAQRLAEAEGLAILLVVDGDGRLVGFLTRKALGTAPNPALPAGKLATAPTVTLTPDDPLERAVVFLAERYLLLPVVGEGGRLVGVLTRGGLLRGLAQMTGFGEEGTRIHIRPSQPAEVYRALAVLGAKGLPLVAVIRGSEGEVILHVQGVEDRDRLMGELKEALG
jgi:predicted transcriptional regulator